MKLENIYISVIHARKINRFGIKDKVLNIINYFIDYENRFNEYNTSSCRAIVYVFMFKCDIYSSNNVGHGEFRIPCDFGNMIMKRWIVSGKYHISLSLKDNNYAIAIEFSRELDSFKYIKASELEKFGE